MNILITNDDGIYSPGLATLAQAARRFGDVKVVAPDFEQSSMGHAITSTRPLYYKTSVTKFEGIDAYRVNGTPADCVALGTHIWPKTEIVLSGINMGPNLGNAMWHSGTLAGAKQAVLLGKKGIALSLMLGKEEPNFGLIQNYLEQVLEFLLKKEGLYLFNVNFPTKPIGIKFTRQSVRFYDGKIVPGIDPMGRKHYWYTVHPLEPAEENTDRWAVENNYVSITPLRLNLTNEEELSKLLLDNTLQKLQKGKLDKKS